MELIVREELEGVFNETDWVGQPFLSSNVEGLEIGEVKYASLDGGGIVLTVDITDEDTINKIRYPSFKNNNIAIVPSLIKSPFKTKGQR